MRCACIDIGSNTTRVLVADVAGGVLTEVSCEKAFTRIGSTLREAGALTPAVGALVADTVAVQAACARAAGAGHIRVVATAAIRTAVDAHVLIDAVDERAGLAVEVLPGDEEARLAFAGALAMAGAPARGRVAVVDVGGGSTEIAVGRRVAEWSTSVPVGSSALADAHLTGDPPGPAELDALAAAAAGAFAGVVPPRVTTALAVGGSATSMARLVGGSVSAAGLADALDTLGALPRAQVAELFGLEAERVRLLPAGLHLLAAASARLGQPLRVVRGGLREGVCLDLARR